MSSQQMNLPLIIKIGGGSSINKEGIIRDLAQETQPFIVVLGANAIRDELAERLDSPTKTIRSVSGYESVYSNDAAIEMIMMSYAGLARNQFVETCQKHGINAIGLSGLDGKLIQGNRNKAIRVRHPKSGKLMILRDRSGKPHAINSSLLKLLLNDGYTPVLSIPIIDENQTAINADNDNIVVQLQQSLGAKRIYQFIEAPGLLADLEDPNSLIQSLDPDQLKLQEKRTKGRMQRKLMAIGKLYENAQPEVIIADGRNKNPYLDAKAGKGTFIGVNLA